tara:strand:+ start:1356 stop:2177 length:822 start_codon:yes stop_codon:yes gene_type:complete
MNKIIYDLGASRGENIPYYLLKSDLVIAVEADPQNCQYIEKKFHKEIKSGKLILESCILAEKNKKIEKFYIHKNNYLLGQFPRPIASLNNNFYEIDINCKDVLDVVKFYGKPYYIKIDLEEYDEIILKRILSNNIKPNYISIEATNPNIFKLLYSLGGYKSYKLVEGNNVEHVYKNTKIYIKSIINKYSFPKNSAGPFGNEIDGAWINKENFTELMEFKSWGWRDIHCSLFDLPEKEINPKKYINIEIKRDKKVKLIKRLLRIRSKFNYFFKD